MPAELSVLTGFLKRHPIWTHVTTIYYEDIPAKFVIPLRASCLRRIVSFSFLLQSPNVLTNCSPNIFDTVGILRKASMALIGFPALLNQVQIRE